jgi:hypothetical protein
VNRHAQEVFASVTGAEKFVDWWVEIHAQCVAVW